MFFYLILNNTEYGFLENLRISTFNVVSVLSGTGYVTADFSSWGKFPLIFFLFLMFIGGCAGSTTCGIKIFRFQILGHFMLNQIKKLVYPHGVFSMKYNNDLSQKECPITMMDFELDEEISKLPCGHLFNTQAINRWLKDEDYKCPVCRRKLEYKEIKKS